MKDVLSLLEATLSLWPELPGGAADLDSPIWVEACANHLRMERVSIQVETRPTGALTPRRHTLTYLHSIEVGHLLESWNDRLPAPLPAARLVLQVTWVPETWAGQTRNQWMRRVYRGVTVVSDQDADRDGVGIERATRLAAELVEETGGTGTPSQG